MKFLTCYPVFGIFPFPLLLIPLQKLTTSLLFHACSHPSLSIKIFCQTITPLFNVHWYITSGLSPLLYFILLRFILTINYLISLFCLTFLFKDPCAMIAFKVYGSGTPRPLSFMLISVLSLLPLSFHLSECHCTDHQLTGRFCYLNNCNRTGLLRNLITNVRV